MEFSQPFAAFVETIYECEGGYEKYYEAAEDAGHYYGIMEEVDIMLRGGTW